jgi:hypothetical protein
MKDILDKINFLDIAKSELKSAGYIIAANQVMKGITKVISSAAKKTNNKQVEEFVESAPGTAAINFALAAGAKKLPKVGESEAIKYIASGLRVGSLAKLGNTAIDKIFNRKKNTEDKDEKVPEKQNS